MFENLSRSCFRFWIMSVTWKLAFCLFLAAGKICNLTKRTFFISSSFTYLGYSLKHDSLNRTFYIDLDIIPLSYGLVYAPIDAEQASRQLLSNYNARAQTYRPYSYTYTFIYTSANSIYRRYSSLGINNADCVWSSL